jgi:hypothetical protein
VLRRERVPVRNGIERLRHRGGALLVLRSRPILRQPTVHHGMPESVWKQLLRHHRDVRQRNPVRQDLLL